MASKIMDNIGGKENIIHLEHCSTRLRFTLHNDDLANIPALEKIDGVMGVRQNVQCQVIIGSDVVEVYDAILKLQGSVNTTNTTDIIKDTKQNKKISAILLDFLISIFQPLIPAIAGGGVLKSFLMLFAMLGIIDDQGSTYKIINLIGGAPLYFLPLLVAMTTANKLKVNQLVALSAVSVLLLPDMVSMLKDGSTLFTFSLENIAYASQVFPAILTVLFYAVVEKFFTKYSFKVIRIFFVPMMSLLITVPVALIFLGPLGYNIGVIFSAIIIFFYTHFGWIATGLLAAVLPLMVVTGMHKAMIPYALATIGETGTEMLYMPASLAHNIAESGACFAVSLKTKNGKLKSTAISAGISALFGITEPALYGITMLHKKVLYSVMGAAFIGGFFSGLFALKAFVLVGPGLASITMFIDKNNVMNLVWAFATLGLSFVSAFIFSIVLFRDHIDVDNSNIADDINLNKIKKINSPVSGKVIPMSDINDTVFASGAVGQGVGIIPNQGNLVAPARGTILMIFHTKHAISMKLENGADLLFHIGIDTVKLEGVGFEVFVNEGDIVNPGDILIKFDLDKIESNNLDPTVICVVTNQHDFKIKPYNLNQEITSNDAILAIEPIKIE